MSITFEELRELIAQQFDRDTEDVTMETTFTDDLDADSLDLVDLSMELEDQFGISEMKEEDVERIKTVGDLYHYIQDHLAKS